MSTEAVTIETLQGCELDRLDEQQVYQLLTHLAQTNPASPEKVQEQLARMSGSEQCYLSVARGTGSRLLAMATTNILHTPNISYGFIDAVVRRPEASKGLGRLVAAAALEHALVELDVDKVMLTSRPSREYARRMYAGLGFLERDTDVFELTKEGWPSNAA